MAKKNNLFGLITGIAGIALGGAAVVSSLKKDKEPEEKVDMTHDWFHCRPEEDEDDEE